VTPKPTHSGCVFFFVFRLLVGGDDGHLNRFLFTLGVSGLAELAKFANPKHERNSHQISD
jgi:hypothetical protein